MPFGNTVSVNDVLSKLQDVNQTNLLQGKWNREPNKSYTWFHDKVI